MKTLEEALQSKCVQEGSVEGDQLMDAFERFEPTIDEAVDHPVVTAIVLNLLSLGGEPVVFGRACLLAGLQIGLEMNQQDLPEVRL